MDKCIIYGLNKNGDIMENIYLGEEFIETTLKNVKIKKEMSKSGTVGIYLMRAAMSGVVLGCTYLVYLALNANFQAVEAAAIGKLLGASFFSFCLFTIYATKSELLTSNMMILTVGKFFGKITIGRALAIMALCLFGNFIGGVFISVLLGASSLINPGMESVLSHLVESKQAYIQDSAYLDLLIRAILCNFFINLSMLMVYNGNLKSDIGKFMAIFFGVFVFVYMGLEHSVANLVLFTMTYFYDLFHGTDILIMKDAIANVGIVLLGNYIGGGLLIGLYYSVINNSKKFKK
jgi:formate/nitrite transporter